MIGTAAARAAAYGGEGALVFKRMLAALGVGGPSVDTVLTTTHCRPGGELRGEVRIAGGDHDVEIREILISLVTGMELEHGDSEAHGLVEFHQTQVAGAFAVAAGEHKNIPFAVPLPWETPLTSVYGRQLHGMVMGVRTDLVVAGARDKGDLDPVEIEPLPSQERVLGAFGELGFSFKNADVEHGHIHGVAQELPFYQELEFYPPHGGINEVELTFVASPTELTVVLEADKRGDIFHEGHDVFGRFTVTHDEALHMDWAAEISRWLSAVAEHHGHHGGHGHHDAHGHHGGHGGHGSMGAVAAGVAVGVAGGMVAEEIVEEVVEEFFEDEDEDDFEE